MNSQSKDGFAPLHMATAFGITDMVPVLVKVILTMLQIVITFLEAK